MLSFGTVCFHLVTGVFILHFRPEPLSMQAENSKFMDEKFNLGPRRFCFNKESNRLDKALAMVVPE